MTIGQRLEKISRKALEEFAAREFSRDLILKACNEAAAKGFISCQIRPTLPLDVSSTQHMKTLRADLEKERLELIWIPCAPPGEMSYTILEIRWQGRQQL